MNRFYPGEFVKEEMEARGWIIEDLSANSDLTLIGLRELIAGKRKITPVYALGLSHAFGTTKEYWMNLQRNYDGRKERGSE